MFRTDMVTSNCFRALTLCCSHFRASSVQYLVCKIIPEKTFIMPWIICTPRRYSNGELQKLMRSRTVTEDQPLLLHHFMEAVRVYINTVLRQGEHRDPQIASSIDTLSPVLVPWEEIEVDH